MGKKDMPVLHDEFAHVPCYNIEDLKADNSSRVFWGESIKRGWDNIFNTPGALGCAIWAATDDVFYLPEKTMEKHQTHLQGECAGYGEWGCIFDAFKRLKPEAYLTKKAFSPVKITDTAVYGDEIRFNVQNRFDHTNLNELTVTVKDKNSNILYENRIQENIEPHGNGAVSLWPLHCNDAMQLAFLFDGIVVESTVLNKTNKEMKISPSPIHAEYAQSCIRIRAADDTIAVINGMYLYTGLHKFGVLKNEITKINAHTYSVDFGFGRAFLLMVRQEENAIHIQVRPKNKISSLYFIGELGVDMDLAEDVQSVSWVRHSLYNAYPGHHIARDCGTARKAGAAHHYDDPNIRNIAWEQDMSAYAYYEKASRYNHTAGNDFRTKRLRIKQYLVHTADDAKILIQTDCSNINAYAGPFDSKLHISKGYYKPSLLWGNYCGERFHLNTQNTFEFTISFEDCKAGWGKK